MKQNVIITDNVRNKNQILSSNNIKEIPKTDIVIKSLKIRIKLMCVNKNK